MSSLAGWYGGVEGISAFAAGVASTLADEKLSGIMPKYCCLETDVFEASAENLCERFRERIQAYRHFGDPDKNSYARELRFELRPVQGTPQECIEALAWGNDGSDQRKRDYERERGMIGEFFAGIRFQLGDPRGVYEVKRPLDGAAEKAFSDFYVYIVMSVYFVEYEDYFLMLAFGSNE